MQSQLLQVAAFMQQFGQPLRWSPTDTLPLKEAKLRIDLGDEEQEEWKDSFSVDRFNDDDVCVNRAEALDALCDRLYILLGDVHTLGFGFILPAAFRRVHESNMSKLWTKAEVDAAGQTNTNLTFTRVSTKAERRFIARNQLGKIIKSPSYIEAALADLLDDLDGQELLNFDRVTTLVYGDADEPDIDELYEEFCKDSDDEED